MDSAAMRHDHQPIVGREREQMLLSEQLRAMLSGRGRLVLISGVAGIGKTTLVRDFVERIADRDVLVLTGGSYDLTTTPPYGPWIEALDSVATNPDASAAGGVPGFRGWDAGGLNPLDLAEQIDSYLADLSQIAPVVLVLEDVHWADAASLDLLRFMARRASRRRILLLATFRSDEPGTQHHLGSMLPALVRESSPVRIDLRPLDRDAIELMVQAEYDLPQHDEQRLSDYLHALGGGNPLYMREMMRTLEADGRLASGGDALRLAGLESIGIPPLLQQAIHQRLSQLTETTRDGLAMAAVIGQDVPIDQWNNVSGLSDAHLVQVVQEAMATHVFEEHPGGTGLRFSHALLRESLYRSIPLPLRRAQHLVVAEALKSLPDANPYTVAHHFQQAGDVQSVEWFVRAGLRARTAAAWFSAAEAFESAAAGLEGNGSRVREYGWLRFEAGFLQRFSGDPRSIDHLDAAEQAGLEVGDPLLVAFSRYARGSRLAMRGVVNHGLHDMARGIAEIDALLDTQPVNGTEEHSLAVIRSILDADRQGGEEQRLVVQGQPETGPRLNQQRGVLINWLGMSGRYREAIAVGEPFVASFIEAFGDAYVHMSQCVTGRRAIGHAYAAMGRPEDARQELDLARAGYREHRDYAILGEVIWNELVSVVLPYAADQIAERSRLVDEATDTWERCIGITIVTDGDGPPARLPVDMLEGRWPEAVQMARDHRTSPWLMLVQEGSVTIGAVARHQGDLTTAWRCVEDLFPQGPATAPGDSHFLVAISGVALAADLAMDGGDLQTAQQWIDMHQRWLDWNGAHTWVPDTALLRARFHQLSGDLSLARKHAEDSLRLAGEPRQPLRLMTAHRMLGMIAAQEGDHTRAESHLLESIALASACAAVFELAVSRLELAGLQVSTNRAQDARVLLDQAQSTFERLHAAPMLARVAALRGESGTDAVAIDGTGERLTAREREVLRMVVTGMSNREIAHDLFLSPRTVERHVANIYLKLDVHNKAEAVAYALQHNVT